MRAKGEIAIKELRWPRTRGENLHRQPPHRQPPHRAYQSTYHFSTLQDTATDLVGPYGKQRRLVCRADPRNGTLHARAACASESLDRHTIQTALDRLALSPTRQRRVAHRAPVTRNNARPDATTAHFLCFLCFFTHENAVTGSCWCKVHLRVSTLRLPNTTSFQQIFCCQW